MLCLQARNYSLVLADGVVCLFSYAVRKLCFCSELSIPSLEGANIYNKKRVSDNGAIDSGLLTDFHILQCNFVLADLGLQAQEPKKLRLAKYTE